MWALKLIGLIWEINGPCPNYSNKKLYPPQPRARCWNPSRVWGASTPVHGGPSLYVWTSQMRCCGCCCAGRLRRREVVVGTNTRRRRSWSTTFSTPTHDYIGRLLQLFRYTTRLVVMIHNLLLVGFPRWHCRSSTSVACPFQSSRLCVTAFG
jgi:hypothetical protein